MNGQEVKAAHQRSESARQSEQAQGVICGFSCVIRSAKSYGTEGKVNKKLIKKHRDYLRGLEKRREEYGLLFTLDL